MYNGRHELQTSNTELKLFKDLT